MERKRAGMQRCRTSLGYAPTEPSARPELPRAVEVFLVNNEGLQLSCPLLGPPCHARAAAALSLCWP